MSVVLSFPKSQLWYGATSLGQTFHSVVEASFYRLNPNILSPLVYPLALQLKPFLLPALLAFCAGKAALALSRREGGDGWLVSFGGFLTGAVSIALGAHWISFRLFHIPLPLDRTALFLVPLPLAITGATGALRPSSQVEKVFHKGLTATLLLLAVYFICCLRLTYFKEWIWDADVKSVYSVLAYYNHRYGVEDVGCSWRYTSALNFYRAVSGRETLAEFAATPANAVDS